MWSDQAVQVQIPNLWRHLTEKWFVSSRSDFGMISVNSATTFQVPSDWLLLLTCKALTWISKVKSRLVAPAWSSLLVRGRSSIASTKGMQEFIPTFKRRWQPVVRQLSIVFADGKGRVCKSVRERKNQFSADAIFEWSPHVKQQGISFFIIWNLESLWASRSIFLA